MKSIFRISTLVLVFGFAFGFFAQAQAQSAATPKVKVIGTTIAPEHGFIIPVSELPGMAQPVTEETSHYVQRIASFVSSLGEKKGYKQATFDAKQMEITIVFGTKIQSLDELMASLVAPYGNTEKNSTPDNK